MSARINDPLGFANGVMPGNPPKAYRAVIMRPDGSVSITHEFPRGFLEQVVIPDALAQVPGGRLLEIIRDEDKEAWIRAHTKPKSGSPAPRPRSAPKSQRAVVSRSERDVDPELWSIAEEFAGIQFDEDPYGCAELIDDEFGDNAPQFFHEMMPYLTRIFYDTLIRIGIPRAIAYVKDDHMPNSDSETTARYMHVIERLEDVQRRRGSSRGAKRSASRASAGRPASKAARPKAKTPAKKPAKTSKPKTKGARK